MVTYVSIHLLCKSVLKQLSTFMVAHVCMGCIYLWTIVKNNVVEFSSILVSFFKNRSNLSIVYISHEDSCNFSNIHKPNLIYF